MPIGTLYEKLRKKQFQNLPRACRPKYCYNDWFKVLCAFLSSASIMRAESLTLANTLICLMLVEINN